MCVARQWEVVRSVGDFIILLVKNKAYQPFFFFCFNKNAQALDRLKQLPRILSPGSVLWFIGWLVNVHSDHILRNLRQPGESGYKIPTGKNPNGRNTSPTPLQLFTF